MVRRTPPVILRLNIPCRQRQVIQQWLYKVRISIIIQAARDIFNIEEIVQ